MSQDSQKPKEWHAVGEVTGVNFDGGGRFVVRELQPSFLDAAMRAEKMPATFAPLTISPPNREPAVNRVYKFTAGKDAKLDQAAKEFEWQKESKQAVIVCRMEGKFGMPEKNMEVRYDSGRGEHGRARDREARSTRYVTEDQKTKDTYYATVERYDGIASKGKVTGVYPEGERSLAKQHAESQSQAMEQQKQRQQPVALKQEAITGPAKDIGENVRARLRQRQQDKEIEP